MASLYTQARHKHLPTFSSHLLLSHIFPLRRLLLLLKRVDTHSFNRQEELQEFKFDQDIGPIIGILKEINLFSNM